MTKVIINACYGVFSLSQKACAWLGEHGHLGALEHINERGADERYGWFDYRPENRTDPLIIECAETLGRESWGSHAELKVVEVPDEVKWLIEEYDGVEWVAEEHRVWS